MSSSLLFLLGTITEPPGVTYDESYQAILDEATSQGYGHPSDACKLIHDNAIYRLKEEEIWDEVDVLVFFANDSADGNFDLINWKNAAGSKATLSNSPPRTIKRGYKGNAIDAFITLPFTPSSGVNYLQDDASVYEWVWASPTTGNALSGNATNGWDISSLSNSAACRVNQTTANLNAAVNLAGATGLIGKNRTSNTNVEVFHNTTQYSRTATSTSRSANASTVFRSAGLHSDAGVSMSLRGKNLVSKNTALLDIMNEAMTAIAAL